MLRMPLLFKSTAAAMLAALLLAQAALADPPGRGRGKPHGHGEPGGGGVSLSVTIGSDDRMAIQQYYGAMIQSGHCPPGLAKKNNGCLPPGQAKKWMRGQPLPGGMIYHALPPDLGLRLHAPAGAKYVRVAADILLIAVGTGLVLDAVEDLNRM